MPTILRSLLVHLRFTGLTALVFAIGVLAAPTPVQASDSPIGVWKTIDDETGETKSLVKIYENNGKIKGKVIKLLKNPGATCDKCEGDEKGAPIKGMIIMWALEKDGDEWSGGRIFDPKKGKTYRCKIWLENGKLKVRGYAGPFYRTQTWTRM